MKSEEPTKYMHEKIRTRLIQPIDKSPSNYDEEEFDEEEFLDREADELFDECSGKVYQGKWGFL